MEQANNADTERRTQLPARRLLAALVAAALVVYWLGNARTPLWDRDEPRFAQATREMLATGDFIVPHFHGELRVDKPILGYYFFAAGMKAFGENEFGARFFSAIFGALSVTLLFFLAQRMTGSERVALAAAAMLAAAPTFFVESKLCTVDAGLVFWILLAYSGLWRIYEGRSSWRPKALFWAALAFGVLTKGPVTLTAVFVPVLLMALLARDRSFLRRFGWLWGIPLFVAIALPWSLAVQARTGGVFLRESLGIHVVERVERAINDFRGFPGYYIVTLFGTFFPWAFFVPGALLQALKGIRDRRLEIFLVSWAAGHIFVLEFVKTKMAHYSLAAFPALAVLVAVFIAKVERPRSRLLFAGALAAFVMAVALAVAPVAAAVYAGLDRAVAPLAAGGGILALGMGWAVLSARRGRYFRAAFATAFAWLLVMSAWALPTVGSYSLSPLAAAKVDEARKHYGPDVSIMSLGFQEPTLVWYTGGEVEFATGVEDFQGREPLTTPRILIMPEDSAGALENVPWRTIEKYSSVTGVNFDKGRITTLDIYLDYGGALQEGE